MRLRAIERTTGGSERLAAALQIYRDTILPEAQNPEKQILYWIDHAKEQEADEFRCFLLESSRSVTGYFQYSYFCEENILFLEYLCVRDDDRSGLRPTEAIDIIKEHIAEAYPKGLTVAFEIAKVKGQAGSWVSDHRLKTYFLALGFRAVAFDYRYPVLQSYDGAISYPADLMVRLPDCRTTISACELRTVLRCIYFKHYLRWDRPFLGEQNFRERERLINDLYAEQVRRIGATELFSTDGVQRRIARLATEPRRSLRSIFGLVFGPKLPRLVGSMLIVLVLYAIVGSTWVLVPFMFLVLIIYGVTEDTKASRRLLLALVSKARPSAPPR
jgi:hypothetical protein